MELLVERCKGPFPPGKGESDITFFNAFFDIYMATSFKIGATSVPSFNNIAFLLDFA